MSVVFSLKRSAWWLLVYHVQTVATSAIPIVQYLNETLHAETRNSRCQPLFHVLFDYCLILMEDFCVGQLVLLSILHAMWILVIQGAQIHLLYRHL